MRLLNLFGVILLQSILSAQPAALGGEAIATLPEKTISQLSDSPISRLGEKALNIHSDGWKHSESDHFIYHYFNGFVAEAVSSEAEFYYKAIAKELERDTSQWERKSQIYIFETDDDWRAFVESGNLERWTGGLHAGGELFIQRNPSYKFKGPALAHEVTHLVVHRFYEGGVPLWLDEGLAENTATRWHAAYMRARGYDARPHARSVSGDAYIPVASLASMSAYPEDDAAVITFYSESERLVRFLSETNKAGFITFLEAMSRGNRFETALDKGFGSKFQSAEDLDSVFKKYATQEYAPEKK